MSINLSAEQLEQIEHIVRTVTVQAIDEPTKQLVKQLVLAGHSSHTIAADFAERGSTRLLVNGVRWYAEDLESNLMFVVLEERK